jgi:hypothetical protein
VFSNPEAAWNQVQGYLQQLMAWFFDAIAQGPIGKYLFKDAADDMRRNSKINAGASIDEKRFAELKDKEKAGTLKDPKDVAELAKARTMIKEAAAAMAEELRHATFDESKATELAKTRLAEQGLDPTAKVEVTRRDGSKTMMTNQAVEFQKIKKEFEDSIGKRDATANALYGGKYTEEEQIRIFKKGFADLNIPGKALGTVGTTGKLVQNFGTESLVKLHGNEAVLTEDQLANMAKGIQNSSSGSNPDGMKFIADGLINLNKQTAVSNKLLGEVVEYNRRLLDKSTRNRLLA